jgi:hypothetical protein
MDVRKVFNQIKVILAEAAEQRYGWTDNDTLETYDHETALLRNISPNHSAALMHYSEKFALHYLAFHLPKKSTVVEIGSFLGGSAAIMSFANPDISIVGVDAFDQNQHTVVEDQQLMIERVYGKGKIRSQENAQRWINSFSTNVTFVQALSPYNCEHLNVASQEIDVYFEDAVHADPGLEKNINFWFPKVKSGGLVLMHDFRPWMPPKLSMPPWRFKDVERHIDRLVRTEQADMIGYVRGLAILVKN